MGSYENIVKLEAMRKRMEENDMASALKILETIVIKKIKNMSDLSLIAEVYAENERYEEAAQLYLKIYEKTKTRKSLYQLVDLSIKTNNLEDAQYYLVEYQKAAPRDFYKYIFRYKIDKLKGAPYEKLIETLETLKTTEYMEKWAYELAKTYYKAGMDKECIKECSDIILWFGDGPYVEKAKILKSYFSGETDKEKIMEDLKRRATGVKEITTDDRAKGSDGSETDDSESTAYTIEYTVEGIEDMLDNRVGIANAADQEAEYIEAASNYEEADTYEKDDIYEETGTYKEADTYKKADTYEETDTYKEADTYKKDVSYAEEFEITDLEAAEDTSEFDDRLNAIAAELELDLNVIFGDFLSDDNVKRQIVESLENILEDDGEPVRMLIAGEAGSGKTALAKGITVFLYEAGMLRSSRIAKIDAQKLNTIDIFTKRDTLRDCCLVIEHAGNLQAATIESLLELCDSLWKNIAVIFEENQNNAERLFMEYPRLENIFRNWIYLT